MLLCLAYPSILEVEEARPSDSSSGLIREARCREWQGRGLKCCCALDELIRIVEPERILSELALLDSS